MKSSASELGLKHNVLFTCPTHSSVCLLKLPSFSPKRGHVIEKHVLIGCKHDMLGNQTFEVLRPLSKLSRQGLKVFEFVGMFSMNKYGRNFKPGIPLSKDFRNDVIQRYKRSIFSRLQFSSTFSYHV